MLNKDDSTFDENGMTPEQRWSYYTASFINRQPTEGLNSEKIRMPFLERNRPGDPDEVDDPRLTPVINHEGLLLRVAVNSYKLTYDKDTEDWFVHNDEIRTGGKEGIEEAARAHVKRAERFQERFVKNNKWIREASKEEVETGLSEYTTWIEGVKIDEKKPVADEDQAMADA